MSCAPPPARLPSHHVRLKGASSGQRPAYNVALGSKLADSLAEAQRLSSPYNSEGKLTEEVISLSREIKPPYRFPNDLRIPSGMAKYSTRSHESPYDNCPAHFYMNSKTKRFSTGLIANPFSIKCLEFRNEGKMYPSA